MRSENMLMTKVKLLIDSVYILFAEVHNVRDFYKGSATLTPAPDGSELHREAVLA